MNFKQPCATDDPQGNFLNLFSVFARQKKRISYIILLFIHNLLPHKGQY